MCVFTHLLKTYLPEEVYEEKSEYEDLEDAMAEEDNSVEYTGEY